MECKTHRRKGLTTTAAAILGTRRAAVDQNPDMHTAFSVAFPLCPTMQADNCLSSPHTSSLRYRWHMIVHKSLDENCVEQDEGN